MAVPATSFSLTEKLAVMGAFLALVAMAIGTEEDPGVIAATQVDIGADPAEESATSQPASIASPPQTVTPPPVVMGGVEMGGAVMGGTAASSTAPVTVPAPIPAAAPVIEIAAPPEPPHDLR